MSIHLGTHRCGLRIGVTLIGRPNTSSISNNVFTCSSAWQGQAGQRTFVIDFILVAINATPQGSRA